jgi:Ni,Fe-hydrogenase III small subunit/formate hydrogenlyase subunit 6/NADH:ubiquinone oxidoreductase subunit I
MIKALLSRLHQGHRTMAFPDGPPPPMPDRFRGRPQIDSSRCPSGCEECAKACPTSAIALLDGKARIDLGRCLFCTDCVEACPEKVISYTRDYRLAVLQRQDLVIDEDSPEALKLASAMNARVLRLFGRSLKLRQVSAGGCNACEADVNVLNTIGWDLGRFGIQFVASPRHADGLLITGCVPRNMELALRKTYEAVPDPKIIIAIGACAISGGPYIDHPEILNGAPGNIPVPAPGGIPGNVPVDLFVPGCPPHPVTILDGLLRLLGRIDESHDRRTANPFDEP